jgi:hypothetical protein
MCCGQKRSALRIVPTPTTSGGTLQNASNSAWASAHTQEARASAERTNSAVTLFYLRNVPIRLRGSASGRVYVFSAFNPIQSVDHRDAPALLHTHFFRLTES